VAGLKDGWRQPIVDHIFRWLNGEIEEEEWPARPEDMVHTDIPTGAGALERMGVSSRGVVWLEAEHPLSELGEDCRKFLTIHSKNPAILSSSPRTGTDVGIR
jgi:hypothetical protein